MLESPSQSDDDLLRLISKGHEPAFVEFYRKHQRAVYRFALHMSGKTEIAEEVTQDVFMAVMKAAKQYDSNRGPAISARVAAESGAGVAAGLSGGRSFV
jgi:RNA polymerase sigma-70 factor (ECF subfamily)